MDKAELQRVDLSSVPTGTQVPNVIQANVIQVVPPFSVPSFVHDLDDMDYKCTLVKFGFGQDVIGTLTFYTDMLEFKSQGFSEKVEFLIKYNNIINVTVDKKKRLCIDYTKNWRKKEQWITVLCQA